MATNNNKQKFNAHHPVYIKHTDVSMIKGNTLITICNASNKSVNNHVLVPQNRVEFGMYMRNPMR